MKKSHEQTLIDCCFTFALMSKAYMVGKDNEEVAKWVAHNLAELGFHTRPMGMSWGVLCEPPEKEIEDDKWAIIEPGRPD